MKAYRGWIIALAAGLCAVLLGLVLVGTGQNAVHYVRENYSPVAGASQTYECRGDRDATARDIRDHERPDADQLNEDTRYLRYGDDMIVVGRSGDLPCRVQLDGTPARSAPGDSSSSVEPSDPAAPPGPPEEAPAGSARSDPRDALSLPETRGDTVTFAAGPADHVPELLDGIGVSLAYFGVGALVLTLGFVMLDLLTPGSLRHHVFVDHRPNAAALFAASAISLAIIVVTVMTNASDSLVLGLIDVAVYGLLGVIFQAVTLVILELLVPGRFRDLVSAPRFSTTVLAVAATLLAVAAVNAAAIA